MPRIRPKDTFPKPEVTPRTEDEIVAQAPLIVLLGGIEYEIKPLVIKESRLWRQKLSQEIEGFAEFRDTENPDNFAALINANLVTRPEAAIDLFFAYAKDLNRDEIEATATDYELGIAFQGVLKIALPLAGGVTPAMGIASQQVKPTS